MVPGKVRSGGSGMLKSQGQVGGLRSLEVPFEGDSGPRPLLLSLFHSPITEWVTLLSHTLLPCCLAPGPKATGPADHGLKPPEMEAYSLYEWSQVICYSDGKLIQKLTDTHNNIDESQIYHADWIQLCSKSYVFYGSIYMTFYKSQNYMEWKQICGCLELEMGKRDTEDLGGE